MSKPMLTCLFATAALAAGASTAQAQTPASDPAAVVKSGDRIVISSDQARLPGRVIAVTSSSLTLEVDAKHFVGADPARKTIAHTVPLAGIQRIQRADTISNGVLIGFAAGAFPGAVVGSISCGEGSSGACLRNRAIGVLILGGLGGVIGAGIDGSITKTIYRRGTTATVGMRGAGFGMSVRF